MSKYIHSPIHYIPEYLCLPWKSKRLAASQTRVLQWQRRLLGDGRQIQVALARLNPKELCRESRHILFDIQDRAFGDFNIQ